MYKGFVKGERRTIRTGIRANRSEMRLLKKAAKDRGQTLGSYLRLCGLLYATSRANEDTDMYLTKAPPSGPQGAA